MMTVYPTPHLDKLNATLANEKLPPDDKPRIERAIERHREWVQQLDQVEGTPEEILERMVSLLTEYRTFIDLDLIFRQRARLPLPPSGTTQAEQQRH